MMTNSAPYDEASWGETLKNYRKTTNSLPWQQGEFVPTKRETVYEKSRKEREFNPILMKFRDDTKETSVTQREKAFAAVRLNDAKDKQLCFEQKFDIINHKTYLPREYEERSKKNAMQEMNRRKAPDSRLTYNIISHMGKEEHFNAKMVPRDGEEFILKRNMETTLEGGLKPKSHQTREFDVLTNKYIANDTARQMSDLERQRDELGAKYWKSHDYDILAVRYCDEGKEDQFQQGLKAKERTQGQRQKEKLPPSVKYGEGNVYDIVTNHVRDPNSSAIKDVDEKRNKSVASKQGYKIQEQIRTKAAQDEDLMETRAMNRIKPERFKESRKYGYDPINNVGFQGRLGTEPAPLRQEEQKPVWSRLQGSNRQFGGGPGSGGVAQPRDLSGANNNNNIQMMDRPESNRQPSGRGERQPSGRQSHREQNATAASLTVKPDFVPSLTIPSEGMVNGKLNIRTGGFGSKR
jgi:hypothetical protein